MAALTSDRMTPARELNSAYLPVAANTRIFAGSMVAINATGFVVPAANTGSATTLRVLGRASEHVDNRINVQGPGLDGSLSVKVEYGVFQWENVSGSIDLGDLGSPCYAQDDQSVHLSSDGGNRPIAGRIVDVDDQGVWVEHMPTLLTAGEGALLAANNLDDVDTAATALANIGGTPLADYRRLVVFQRLPLDADGVFRYVHSGPDAEIVALRSVTDGATTTTSEDATIAAAIEGTPVTNGTITIAGASAAGTVDLAEPSAANVISEGEVLSLTVTDGSQIAAAFATVTIELAAVSV